MTTSPHSYVKQHVFYLAPSYHHHSDEALTKLVNQHKVMPKHYCIQKIVYKGMGSIGGPVFQVIAWIAPTAWFGSAEQLHQEGLAYLCSGVPFRSDVPLEWTEILRFSLFDPLDLDFPLAPASITNKLEGITDAVAVYDAENHSIAVYRPKRQPQTPETKESEVNIYLDIVAALCVPLSGPYYFYCPTVTEARIECWAVGLTESHLLSTYEALSNMSDFCLQDFLNLVVIKVIGYHDICSPTNVRFHESARYHHDCDKMGCSKKLGEMTERLLLFSRGGELFINLLTHGFSLPPGHADALYRDFSNWMSAN